MDHSIESGRAKLRQRLIKSIIIIAVATALCYVFSDQILAFLKAPAGDLIEKFVAFSPMDGFIIKMKVALYAGLVLSSPFWAWQLVQFIAPGLYAHERRFAYILLPLSVLLSALGVAFMYFLALPAMLAFFVHFNSTGIGIEAYVGGEWVSLSDIFVPVDGEGSMSRVAIQPGEYDDRHAKPW